MNVTKVMHRGRNFRLKSLKSIIQIRRLARNFYMNVSYTIAIYIMSSDRKSRFVLIDSHIAVAEKAELSPVGIWIEVNPFDCFTRIHW